MNRACSAAQNTVNEQAQLFLAMWLGHESVETTQVYVHADLRLKEKALACIAEPAASTPDRYQPDDALLAFLESL